MLSAKKIVVGITGGIAAYKSCAIVRQLIKMGAEVEVIMTASAQQFVTPLTFETLSGHTVVTEMFGEHRTFGTHHIESVQQADLFLIAPATANIIGKAANGIADDFMSTAITAANCPIFFAPAMNSFMYANPIVQQNMSRLKQYYHFIDPGEGDLACGYEGKGRMAEPEQIVDAIHKFLAPNPLWTGKHVVVTAGPTREKIDPVRFVSNFSSGKMGYAIAEAALKLGAIVTLISGPTQLTPPETAKFISTESAGDMYDAVMKVLPETDVLIKSAAVSDYRPVNFFSQKMKKGQDELVVEMKKTPDILLAVKDHKPKHTIVVGFALETISEVEYARQKLEKKDLDLVVINNPNMPGAGFQTDTNIVNFLFRDQTLESLPLMTKREVASQILKRVERLLVKQPM